jgi:hypothetical protein
MVFGKIAQSEVMSMDEHDSPFDKPVPSGVEGLRAG